MSVTRRRTVRARRRPSLGSTADGILNGIMALAFLGCLVLLGIYVAGRIKRDAAERASAAEKIPPAEGKPAFPGDTRRAPAHGGGGPRASGPSFDQLAADLAMAVISKEISRFRGEGWAVANKEKAAAVAHGNLLARAGDAELADRVLEPADRFVSVEDRDLTAMDPREAADLLTRTFEKVRAGSCYRFHVRRGSEDRVLYVAFAVDAALPDARLTLPAKIKVSDDLAKQIQQSLWGLGTYYQQTYFTPEERAIVERCLGSGEATPEEYVFLTRRLIREAAPEANAEQTWFRSHLIELENRIKTAQVPDVVVGNDGRRVEGRIIEETPQHVKIQTAYGRLTLYRNDVREVVPSEEVRKEFDRRVNAAVQNPEAYPDLLAWTKEWRLPVHREYVAYLMLMRDPADRAARLAAGYYQTEGGRWVMREGGAQSASIDTALPATRGELKARLEEMGFVLREGKWFQKVSWGTGINTLYRSSEVKWTGQGVAIMTAREGESQLAVLTRTQIRPGGAREMFLCPTGPTGTVSISVEAPGEIVECRVRATGCVVERDRMGRIEVALMPEGGKLIPLYSIDSLSNGEYFDVTDALRGKRRFTVSARLTTTNDKFHTYARFLPSLPDTTEAFWVKGTVLQPAPEIDASWAGAR